MGNGSLPYRPCVGVVLFNKDGKVFVGERIDTPGAWQMPQGGIDEGEDLESAARRELTEETSIQDIEILRIADTPIRYDLPSHLQKKFWGGKYRGQEQIWIAARFLGHDADINLNDFDPPEFSAWQWVGLEQTLDLIVPFKRSSYRQIIKMFSDI